jgi:hypothetical protein
VADSGSSLGTRAKCIRLLRIAEHGFPRNGQISGAVGCRSSWTGPGLVSRSSYSGIAGRSGGWREWAVGRRLAAQLIGCTRLRWLPLSGGPDSILPIDATKSLFQRLKYRRFLDPSKQRHPARMLQNCCSNTAVLSD